MPEQPASFDPRRAEQLDQAIDQILAGGTPPASGDAQLDRLVALAARLHRDLPRDLPDPAFRARLKDDLTGRIPIVQPAARRTFALTRLPIYGSLAAVFVLAIAAGVMAIWLDGRDEPPTQIANTTLMSATVSPTSPADASTTATGFGDVVARTAEATMSATTALLLPTATLAPATTAEPSPTVGEAPPATAPPEPATPPAPASATVALASLPAIDSATIEQGPVPAADGGGPGPSADVTYVMAATATTLAASSTVYHLSAPAEDPVDFCRALAERAGIPTDDVHATDASGRTEVFAGEPGAGTIYWRPDAGVFQYSGAATPGDDEITPDAAADRADAWLDAIGYPTAPLGEPRVDDFGDLWLVDFPYAGLPTPGVGYPLSVTVMLGKDGTVTEARGYWLVTTGQESVALVSVADAWKAVTEGGGYWRDGGMSSAGGEFRADSVRLSSVLTNSGDGLVLQPVVEFSGAFTAPDGSSAPISVFVQAAGR